MVKSKETYCDISLEIVLIERADIITASTLSNDSSPNYDYSGWA